MKKWMIIFALFTFPMAGCDTARSILNSAGSGNLSNTEVVEGLKEALHVGTDSATFHLGLLNGFYGDDIIRIVMPPEAQKVEKTLRAVGLGKSVDNAILSMNRAAEDATKYVGNIFWNSIKQMTIQDAFGILRGDDHAATNYLKRTTTAQLTAAFKPIISKSLDYVDATKYWKDVFTAYNRLSSTPVNTDLTDYVTTKALDGLFYHIALREQKIRQDPAARVTDILKKVFANQNAQKTTRL
ncbi:MAG: DUF4197 domain-containing protein [Ginsengibacter sp.]